MLHRSRRRVLWLLLFLLLAPVLPVRAAAPAAAHPNPGEGGAVGISSTIAANGATVVCPVNEQGTASIEITGTWVGTLQFEASGGGTTFTALRSIDPATDTTVTSTTGSGLWTAPVGALGVVRVRASAWTSGTANIVLRASPGASAVRSTNASGGSTTANQGTPGTAANGWPVKVTDGTNTTAVKAASTAAAATDPAAVVSLSPNSPLPAGSNALGSVSVTGTPTVSGTVTANQGTQNGAGTASWNVQGAGAVGAAVSGNPLLVGGTDGTNAQYFRIDPGGVKTSLGTTTTGADAVSNNLLLQPQRTDGTGAYLGVMPLVANGVTWDRLRNNVNAVVQASTATGVSTINTDITTYNAAAIMVHANVTSYGAAGTFLMKLQWKDGNGLFLDIPGATTGSLTTGADVVLAVGPSAWPANTATTFYVNYHLPRTVRLVETIGVNSVTFASSYDLPCN